MRQYFELCNETVSSWRQRGPVALEGELDPLQPGYAGENIIDSELSQPHGVYLFRHRYLPIKYFPPNFHPPYDTAEKRQIIGAVLGRQWNEHLLQWEEL